jgi:colanic acid/amylovoran biosynthesis glycosyltransferase
VSAMHLGKAVIATDSSGLEDYIAPQVTGLTCPAHDDAALAIAMQSLHEDPALSRQLGLAGQRFARQHCSEERVVEYFREFLRSAPGSPR